MLDGRVQTIETIRCEVYDLAGTDGPRGRSEAGIISGEMRPDREGVVAVFRGRELLIPYAVIKAAETLAESQRVS